jgi:hypothetical protein
VSDAWLRTCERCSQTVDVAEAENEADVAAILLAHLALECPGNLDLRAPNPDITYDPPRDGRQNDVIDELRPAIVEDETGFFARWDLVSVGGVILRTHHERLCRPPCCLHSPSAHHMRDWAQAWSQQLLAIFRRCPHGHFHPDPDDLQARTGGLLHTCDGCCLPPVT